MWKDWELEKWMSLELIRSYLFFVELFMPVKKMKGHYNIAVIIWVVRFLSPMYVMELFRKFTHSPDQASKQHSIHFIDIAFAMSFLENSKISSIYCRFVNLSVRDPSSPSTRPASAHFWIMLLSPSLISTKTNGDKGSPNIYFC